jgi:DNA repair protein RadC
MRNWPESEQPRQKCLRQGAANLTNAELLTLILGTGSQGQSALELAQKLLTRFGSIRQILNAKSSALLDITGMGRGKVASLKASLELARRHLRCEIEQSPSLNDTSAACQYVHAELADHPHEVFACLFLDSRNRLIIFEKLFTGTINSAQVHARELVRRSLDHNAAGLILAHNHPSGHAEPSQADCDLTRELSRILAVLDIRVLDHIVVGHTDTVSMAARGLI